MEYILRESIILISTLYYILYQKNFPWRKHYKLYSHRPAQNWLDFKQTSHTNFLLSSQSPSLPVHYSWLICWPYWAPPQVQAHRTVPLQPSWVKQHQSMLQLV